MRTGRLPGGPLGYLSRIVPLNLPNALTLFRIGLVPVMALLVALDSTQTLIAAAAVFGLAAITDVADGHLARSRNIVTTFGRLADPVADKLLVGAALISLVAIDRLELWMAIVIVAREVAVSALRWHAGTQGIVIAVSGLGKVKTAAQMTAIPMLMLVADPTAAWVAGVMIAVVAITVASGLDYVLGYGRQATAVSSTGVAPAARW